MVGRDDCGAAGWMSYTTRRRRLSAVRGEFEKRTLPDDPLPPPHHTAAGSPKCGFPGTETTKPLHLYVPLSILRPHRLPQATHRWFSWKVDSGGGHHVGLPFSRDNNILLSLLFIIVSNDTYINK